MKHTATLAQWSAQAKAGEKLMHDMRAGILSDFPNAQVFGDEIICCSEDGVPQEALDRVLSGLPSWNRKP